MATFQQQLKVGNIGEAAIASYLTSRNWQVTDTTKNESFFALDIDFIANKGAESRTIEVKTDTAIARTGNLFLEISQDEGSSRKGWALTSEAQYLFYYDLQNKICYCFFMEDMRKATQNSAYRKARCFDNHFTRVGVLLPLKEALTKYEHQIIYI